MQAIGLEKFMASQTFGVRFFFTAIGVAINLFWSYYFSRFVMLDLYRNLSRASPFTSDLLLRHPCISAIRGLWVFPRERNPLGTAVALTTILSKFFPILLSNIPFNDTQTATTRIVTAWMTVGILGLMILVLLCSLFVHTPYLPIDPSTVAGAMYYVCDSELGEDERDENQRRKEQAQRPVRNIQLRYLLGPMVGISSAKRIGIDLASKDLP
ncbi:hypothetical protein GQ53DRAFT_674351 [Thozetella sp. PMI_491]|nr:hypothetical protein GQ53DRAFT_674351 [Thozetella sp. PMI_491]